MILFVCMQDACHARYGHEGDVEAQTEMQMFKSRLLTVIGEFGEKGLPLSSLRKKYAQVTWWDWETC